MDDIHVTDEVDDDECRVMMYEEGWPSCETLASSDAEVITIKDRHGNDLAFIDDGSLGIFLRLSRVPTKEEAEYILFDYREGRIRPWFLPGHG